MRDAVELNIIEKATGAAQQRRILAAPSGATDVAHDVSPDCTITGMHRAWPAFAVAVLIATVVASPAGAQVFFSAEPHAPVSIGPLFVAGTAARDAGPMTVNVTWNLVGPSGRRPTAQVLHLFWPAEIAAGTAPGDADAELLRYVDSRGFAPTISGRLLLRARDRSQLGLPTPADPVDVTASFVSFVRRGAPAQAGSGSLVRIPWTPELGNPHFVVTLALPLRGVVGPKPATWLEETFWGRRNVVTMSWGDVGSLPLYPLYFENRDRIVHLAREYSLLVVSFPDADHLRIEEIAPAAAVRRGSRVRTGTETVSIPINTADDATPQTLKVQFAYFSGWFAWRPVMISLGLLVLGNVTGLMILSGRVSHLVRSRLRFRRAGDTGGSTSILAPGALEDIRPGETTYDDVVRRLGPPDEQGLRLGDGDRRTLIYRATRRVPEPGFAVGRLTTIRHWDVERHEVEIAVDGGRARDVLVRVRRSRTPSPE